MLSVTENISHHHYNQCYSGHDHRQIYCHDHTHHSENLQPKPRKDGKETIQAPFEAHEGAHVLKIVRRKRPTREKDGFILCGDDQVVSRVCADCQTSETPLWRSGPAGPKSLCNACGIRYRKRRRRGLGFETGSRDVLLKEKHTQERVSLLLQRNFAGREEAEAAVLLMALSRGLFVHS